MATSGCAFHRWELSVRCVHHALWVSVRPSSATRGAMPPASRTLSSWADRILKVSQWSLQHSPQQCHQHQVAPPQL